MYGSDLVEPLNIIMTKLITIIHVQILIMNVQLYSVH